RATGGTPQLVQTLLDEGISITKGGYNKLTALIDATNEQIKDAVAGSSAVVSPLKVASRLTPVAQRVAQQVNPASDLAAVIQVRAGAWRLRGGRIGGEGVAATDSRGRPGRRASARQAVSRTST